MKTAIAILIAVLIFSYADAQKLTESEVPSSAVASFHKMHPEIKTNNWEKEDGNYEAVYWTKDMSTSVIFDASGVLIMKEKETSVKNLPSGISAYVAKNYSGSSFKEAAQITDAKGILT
ncbi:MAG: hypothetical protein LH473_06990 [Chitinophagales bacterium]|nr:hypothetical protein [Chitinophagales bacterium]